MNQFKIGDKVKFIDNELNRAEISPDAMLLEHSVYAIGIGEVIYIYDYSRPFFNDRFTLTEPAVGSKEWAKQMLLEGNAVTNKHYTGYMIYRDKQIFIHDQSYPKSPVVRPLSYIDDRPYWGWQLYAPAKFKIIIRNENWKAPEHVYCGVSEHQAELVKSLLAQIEKEGK